MSFRNSLADAFRYSQESEGETPEVVDVVEAENADNVEAAIAEVEEVRADIEGGLDAAEKAADDARTLERVAETLEETEEEGGATPAVAEMAEVAVESIYRYYNFRAAPVTSLEAFASKETRIKATRLSVEGIKDTARNLWERVKKFFANLWESVKAFFARIFTAQGRLIARAKKLKEASSKAEKTNSGKVSGGFVSVLSPNKTPNASSLKATIDSLPEIRNVIKTYLDEGESLVGSLNRDFILKAAKANSSEAQMGTLETLASFAIANGVNQNFPAKKWLGLVDDSNYKYYGMTTQTGSFVPVVKAPNLDNDNADLSVFSSAKVSLHQIKDPADSSFEVDTLSKEDCVSVCNTVLTTATGLKDIEGKVKSFESKSKTVVGMLNGVDKELSGEGGGKNQANVFALMRFTLSMPVQAQTTMNALFIKVASAGLDYVQKSLSAKEDKK